MKDETIKNIIAAKLKENRAQFGLTRLEMGEMLDKTPTAYGQQENGIRGIGADELFACSIMIGVPIQDLFPSPEEIPQAYRMIYEQKRKERLLKDREELLAKINEIDKQLEDN